MKKMYGFMLVLALGSVGSARATLYYFSTIHNDLTDKPIEVELLHREKTCDDLESCWNEAFQKATVAPKGKFEFKLGDVQLADAKIKIMSEPRKIPSTSMDADGKTTHGEMTVVDVAWSQTISLVAPQKYYAVRYDDKKKNYYIYKAKDKAILSEKRPKK